MKKIPITLFACSLLIGGLCQAQAHAFLKSAKPKVGSQVHKAPKTVRLLFTEEVEPVFSGIKVLNQKGKRVDKDDTHVAKSNHKWLIVSLHPLDPGTYKVEWKAVSVDTHVTHGHFKFEIAPAKGSLADN